MKTLRHLPALVLLTVTAPLRATPAVATAPTLLPFAILGAPAGCDPFATLTSGFSEPAPAAILDGNPATFWQTPGEAEQHILTVDLGCTAKFVSFRRRMTCNGTATSGSPPCSALAPNGHRGVLGGEALRYSASGAAYTTVDTGNSDGWEPYISSSGVAFNSLPYGWTPNLELLTVATPGQTINTEVRFIQFLFVDLADAVNEVEIVLAEADSGPIDFNFVDGGHSWGEDSLIPYRLRIANSGPTVPNLVVQETVPIATVFEPAASTPGWSCTPGPDEASACTFAIDSLGAGETRELVFAARVVEGTSPAWEVFNEASLLGGAPPFLLSIDSRQRLPHVPRMNPLAPEFGLGRYLPCVVFYEALQCCMALVYRDYKCALCGD